MRSALIIGGSRFVGPELVHRLVARGLRVTVMNRGSRDTAFPHGVVRLRGDRNLRADLLKALSESQPDVVFDTCCYDAVQANLAVEVFGRVSRYVYVSTVSAYQEPTGFPIDEDAPLGSWPLWGEYGLRKAATDRALLDAYAASGFPVVIARPTYVLGPNNHVERDAFFVARLLQQIPIVLPGDGQTLVHVVFADEVAEAVARLSEVAGAEGKAFNVAGDRAVTLSSFVNICAHALGVEERIAFVDPAAYGVSLTPYDATQLSPFANAHVVIDNSRLKRTTGLTFAPLAEKLAYSAVWYAERKATYPVKLRAIERRVLEELGVPLVG
jgi:nucleoside-diphosphate-sugar epimerase